MKTTTLKNALKLFIFLLILTSANSFSFTRLPNEASSSGTESKFGKVKKASNLPKTTVYAASSRGKSMQSKNTALKTKVAPRANLKFGW